IDALIVRAVERAHRGLRGAAGGARDAREEHQLRRLVGLAALGQDLAPAILRLTEHGGDEGRLGILRGPWGRAVVRWIRLVAVARGAVGQGADQDARIDAQAPGGEEDEEYGADAEPAAADPETAAALL